MKIDQKGFSVVEALIILAVIGVLVVIGWMVMGRAKKDTKPQTTGYTQGTPSREQTTQKEEDNNQPDGLVWQQREGGWKAMQDAPACPAQPMMKSPADLTKVTGILYPGQTRGGNYKPHGGFRFDSIKDNVTTVKAPIDGYIVRGGHYLAEGEIQYTFDVMNNCGVMYRIGHLREIPDALQKLTTSWPKAVEGDSRTQAINPAVAYNQGAVLATKVGITKNQNTFFDWGVYDYRQENEASKSAAYQAAHAQDKELSWHAVCWFGWLPSADAAKVKGLPAGDPTSGKNSDYCK